MRLHERLNQSAPLRQRFSLPVPQHRNPTILLHLLPTLTVPTTTTITSMAIGVMGVDVVVATAVTVVVTAMATTTHHNGLPLVPGGLRGVVLGSRHGLAPHDPVCLVPTPFTTGSCIPSVPALDDVCAPSGFLMGNLWSHLSAPHSFSSAERLSVPRG
jgi:hypothetical protein